MAGFEPARAEPNRFQVYPVNRSGTLSLKKFITIIYRMKYLSNLPKQYMDFFSKFNVLGLAIGLMIGSNLKDVANDFIDDILMPFVEPLLYFISGKKENGIKITIPNTSITIDLKRVISSLTKFIALSFIIFIMLQFGIQLKKPIQWVSVRNWNEMTGKKRKKVSLT